MIAQQELQFQGLDWDGGQAAYTGCSVNFSTHLVVNQQTANLHLYNTKVRVIEMIFPVLKFDISTTLPFYFSCIHKSFVQSKLTFTIQQNTHSTLASSIILLQLHPLHPGDEVYMEINNFSWFRVENDTLHLSLIKLNDYQSMKTPHF